MGQALHGAEDEVTEVAEAVIQGKSFIRTGDPMFKNREEAAHQLVQHLAEYKGTRPLVLAIPRGAVPMGKIIAEALEGELDVVLVHKLGAPGHPEYAIGAVSETGDVFLRAQAKEPALPEAYIDREADEQGRVLKARRATYTPDRGPIDPEGRTAIVVDDGVATGATMGAALETVRRARPERLVVAVAVAPAETLERLRSLADEVVCLEVPAFFMAVGQAFMEFEPVTDEDVVRLLRSVPNRL